MKAERIDRQKCSFAFDATTTTLTQVIRTEGELGQIILVTPSFTNDVTTTLSILDIDSYVLWTDSARARGSTFRIDFSPRLLIMADFTLKAVLSGAAGGTGGTVNAVNLVRRVGI